MKNKEKKSKNKLGELTSLLKKVQADFENYKKRVEKEREQSSDYACQELIETLLPVLDSFELAMKNTDNRDIEIIYKQLWNLLSQKGLSKIEALGKQFTPYLHEALLQEKSEKEEGTVIEELQTGYMLKSLVIRTTKVKVATNDKKINTTGQDPEAKQ